MTTPAEDLLLTDHASPKKCAQGLTAPLGHERACSWRRPLRLSHFRVAIRLPDENDHYPTQCGKSLPSGGHLLWAVRDGRGRAATARRPGFQNDRKGLNRAVCHPCRQGRKRVGQSYSTVGRRMAAHGAQARH